jgi:hypothetical protein
VFGLGAKEDSSGVWPCNFWSNFDAKNFSHDFEMLKLEGGNAAIVLFPYFDPDDTRGEAGTRFAQLKKILELCEASNIGLTLRLGYSWDNGFSNSTMQRQIALLTDPEERKRWYRFCEQTHALAARYKIFRGAFICWEDFWGFLTGASLNEPERKAWAAKIRYPKDTVPARNEPAMEEYFDYFDHVFADDFFVATQKYFPDLGMEVRMDDDPIFQDGVLVRWFVHKKMFAAANLRDVYLYWGPFMGAENKGDLISADTAITLLTNALEKAQRLSAPNSRLIVSQFNYRDNTPGFSHNSQIAPDQFEDFIRKSSVILNRYCAGIYTWSNSSYHHSVINNGTFSTGAAFWKFQHAVVGLEDGQACVSIFPGGAIAQWIEPNSAISAGLTDSPHALLEFSAKAPANTTCIVTLGTKSETVPLKGQDRWYRYSVDFDHPQVAGSTLAISFARGALVDDIVLSNHKQLIGALDSNYTRDVTYADLAWGLSRKPDAPAAPVVLSGVTPDNWITSRVTIAAPAREGRYQLTVALTIPECIERQDVTISLSGQSSATHNIALKPGQHRLVVAGNSSDASVRLTLAFAHRRKLSPDGPDVRELAAHLDSVGQ